MNIFQNPKMHVIEILLLTLTLASCGSVHTPNGNITVKKEVSSFARFLNVTVEPVNSGTSISGTLEYKGASRKKILGHVDVVILTNEKEVVNEVRAELERMSHRHAVFSITLEESVSQKDMVLVKYHRSDRHE